MGTVPLLCRNEYRAGTSLPCRILMIGKFFIPKRYYFCKNNISTITKWKGAQQGQSPLCREVQQRR